MSGGLAGDPGAAPGQVLELRVEKAVYRGLGLARHAGQVVWLPRGLPGERVLARLVRRERGCWWAETLHILEPSPERRAAPCPHARACGGCCYQELELAAQGRLKVEILRETLARAGVRWDKPVELLAGPECAWRVRARLHLDAGPPPRLGLHAEGSHRVVEVEHCQQWSPELTRLVAGLRARLGRDPQAVRAARLETIELAEAQDGRRRALVLVGAGGPARVQALGADLSDLPGLDAWAAVGRADGRERLIAGAGEPWLTARVLGCELRWHVRAFFQSNRFLVEPLAALACAWASGSAEAAEGLRAPDGCVLDLYAGVGLFAVPLAAAGWPVLACEGQSLAVADARANGRRAGAAGLEVRCGDVLELLRRLDPRPNECVLLDPPRSGAGPGVVEAVAARRPRRVVYVSCDPSTLGRDLAHFARLGYGLRGLRAFDMFPDTFHVEALALLTAD